MKFIDDIIGGPKKEKNDIFGEDDDFDEIDEDDEVDQEEVSLECPKLILTVAFEEWGLISLLHIK
jgi:phosphopantothenoylcysteine synthetase/decarboxylase